MHMAKGTLAVAEQTRLGVGLGMLQGPCRGPAPVTLGDLGGNGHSSKVGGQFQVGSLGPGPRAVRGEGGGDRQHWWARSHRADDGRRLGAPVVYGARLSEKCQRNEGKGTACGCGT